MEETSAEVSEELTAQVDQLLTQLQSTSATILSEMLTRMEAIDRKIDQRERRFLDLIEVNRSTNNNRS
jgi:predicted transcriptional regulator